ncbi:MAG TPA: M23 family metallopeptidase [Vicinamibacterales bacterium]|nr:M23 family metallopeptidase [Vicinamibacterales bacterium]
MLGRCFLAGMVLAATTAGCSTNSLYTRLTVAPSPHERYADGLRSANLGDTALGREWIRAGENALIQPVTATLPLNETGYFPVDPPTALAYRLELQRGRRLSIELAFDGLEFPRLFTDLFEVSDGTTPSRVASITEGTTLLFDVPRDGAYVLRIQPELLRSGRFTVVQRTLASLPFPVSGLTASAVQSEFGAARDVGRRSHEGIDIFAPRLTPALAVVSGTAQTGTNALGGNVVWLRGDRFGESFYYAHLDRWAFEGTSRVDAGAVLGYIGNTGNARTTSPHLHFGIYDRGAIDPLPFIQADDPRPEAASGLGQLNEMVRVTAARTTLRAGAAPSAAARMALSRGSLARVIGATGAQLRVELPDRTAGYVDRKMVALAQKPLRQYRLAPGTVLRERPLPNAPGITTVEQATTAEVLGEFNGFHYVRVDGASYGWVAAG